MADEVDAVSARLLARSRSAAPMAKHVPGQRPTGLKGSASVNEAGSTTFDMKHGILQSAPPPSNDVTAWLAELTVAVRDVHAAVRALEKRIPTRLVSVKEAAEMLGCSESTVWRKIKSGEIPHRRIGRAVRVDLSRLRVLDKDEVDAMAARARAG